MATLKRFRFFESHAKADAGLPDTATCAVEDEAHNLFLGCRDGTVICLDAGYDLKATFAAHAGPVHAMECYEDDVLCTLGEEGSGTASLALKVWSGRAGEGAPSSPLTIRLFPGKTPPTEAVVAVDMHVSALEWPSVHVAVATAAGVVHIVKCDPKGKAKAAALSCSPLQLEGHRPATHLAFPRTPSVSLLWAVTASDTAAIVLPGGARAVHDARGAAPRGAALLGTRLAVAGPDAVYFYDAAEGQTGALALAGDKSWLAGTGRHLLVAGPAGVGGRGAPSPLAAPPPLLLRLLDPEHKLLAGQAEAAAPLRWVAAGGRGVAACGGDGAVVGLRLLPLDARLAAMCRPAAYALALDVAAREGAPPQARAEVHLQYADALYAKRDYDQALEQYLGTLGHIEPSYVIQRFLSVQRLANLTTYLEKLHAAGLSSPDHTTLLLNCYTKLGDSDKLDAFIASAGEAGGGPPPFDVAAVVAVCRAAGYASHALTVARAAGDSATYLDVLLEDSGQWREGLEYMRGLGRAAAAAALLKHGKGLLANLPVETTALLMELCVPPSPGSTPVPPDDGGPPFVASLADYTHLYTGRPEDLRYACLTIINMGGAGQRAQRALYHTLLDLYLAGVPGQAGAQDAMDLLKRGWPSGGEPAYDVDQALVTCRGHGFSQGLVFLYEAAGLAREAARVLRALGDDDALLALCERRGDSRTGGDPALWRDTLEHFAGEGGEQGAARVAVLLPRIEERRLLPPLVVLKILSQNPDFKLDLVKEYVARQLEIDNRQVPAMAADAEEAERLEEEIESTRAAVARLRSEPTVFQSNRDAATGAPLDLPSVHFLCGHSFNARTLGDDGDGGEGDGPACPLCAPGHARTAALAASNKAWAADKDAFFKQLRASPDGFGVVAEYLGKGVLNSTSVSVVGTRAAA